MSKKVIEKPNTENLTADEHHDEELRPLVQKQIRVYIVKIIHTNFFRWTIICTILFDGLTMALDADKDFKRNNAIFFLIASSIIVVIYTFELLMKLFVERNHYWTNSGNLFDLLILLLYYVRLFLEKFIPIKALNVIRTILALRVLKIASFIEGLQTLMKALYITLKSVVYVLGLLLLTMLMFTIIGCYYFSEVDKEHWGDLASAMFTLFSLVSLDGWTELQRVLDDAGLKYSRIFTIIFILIGYFLFYNMFTGVVLMELQFSMKRIEAEVQKRQEEHAAKKQEEIAQQYNKQIRTLLQSQGWSEEEFVHLVQKFKRSLNNQEFVVMGELYTSLSFIDMYLTTLECQSKTTSMLIKLYEEAMLIVHEITKNKNNSNSAMRSAWTPK